MSRDRIELRSADEVARIREACLIVHDVLAAVAKAVGPGVTTGEIDRLAESLTEARGAKPAFKGYHGYPGVICVSLNDEVVHGIPSPGRRLVAGDIVGLDFGVVYKGWFGDSAVTVPVGKVSPAARRLLDATREALGAGIDAVRPTGRVGDIGAAVQRYVEPKGYSVVRDFVGHGIGRKLHEPPQVPNFGAPKTGPRLRPGMVLAIEPMVNAGGPDVRVLGDGWTAVTVDGSLSAHFEHTVAITEDGPEVLSRP
ncbi:MAG TPA: type I methionyl aminopeptidase [Anaeromyxobacteraceae bacterium]|jgi:methionyl aminopeptidase|nr:type I methionyl aminopeptidase [Anaeromyxobacteraceae bacterium]